MRASQHSKRRPLIVIALVLALVIGGSCFLMTSEVPAPRQVIEKPLDHARFLP